MAEGTMNLFHTDGREMVVDELLDSGQRARCWIERNALSDESLEGWWDHVQTSPAGWSHNDIQVFGRWHKEPRLTAWWGPAYGYANVRWPAHPLEGAIDALTRRVSQMTGSTYNGVLVNGYRNGQDSMGWHRDNEPEIDPASIASLSLGATRTFKVRDRRTQHVWNLDLHHGDVLVMEHLQDVHEHSVPKRAKVTEPRMNFTFRRLV